MARLATTVASTFALSASALSVGSRAVQRDGTKWAGWENIKSAFFFGDSYTETGFDYTQAQPSVENPLGNPPYPGIISTDGLNWVDFITFKYNASTLLTYNFGYSAATVDSNVIPPMNPAALSLRVQVESEFIPGYTGCSAKANWTGDDSIFIIWIGINDIRNTYCQGANVTNLLNDRDFAIMADLVDQIYSAGGRNYVFINVPPLDRSPLIQGLGETAISQTAADVASWNRKVVQLANTLKRKDCANVWIYDSNLLFGQILDDPTSHPETAGLKNTTDYCDAYQNAWNGSPDTFDASCRFPLRQYFWLNNLHPTSAVHEAVAKGVSDMLAAGLYI
ncbi:hypothetical protein GGS21DRAFT_129912 [Xylaria nigripes]|nr:hypothetical protein GGS21DRAFT_129912 [Xylaria nigripes]